MKTKTNYLLILCMVALIAMGCRHQPKPGYCNNKERYNIPGVSEWEGDTIDRKQAQQWVNNFLDSTRKQRPEGDSVKGVFISKQVLDEIFKDPKFNGVFAYFALSEKGDYRILVEGGTTTAVTFKTAASKAVFKPKPYCPPICGPLTGADSIP